MNTVSIVRVVTRLNVGGPTRQIGSLMARLDPSKFRQTLVCGRAGEDEGDGVLAVPGEIVRLDALRRPIAPLADAPALRALTRMFRERRPAIVHTHQGKAGLLGRLAARRAGVPIIVHTYHGHTFQNYFGKPMSWFLLRLERRAARATTALVGQAPGQCADLSAFLGGAASGRVVLIPPGVEPPERPAAPPDGGLVTIVVPARLEPVKDPALALLVARRLGDGYRVVFLGGGTLRSDIARAIAADPSLCGRCEIRDPVSDRAAMFDGAAVTLLTSVAEGTPLSLIESQWHGVPVVAPEVGAVRSVVAPGGGFVVQRDASSLADAVRKASRMRVPAEAASWIASRFCASRMVRDVADLYERLLAGDPAA